MTTRAPSLSPQVQARIVGVSWLLVFAAGSLALIPGGAIGSVTANRFASVCYVVVCLVLYPLLKPVNPAVSLVAALFGLVGCTTSLLGLARVTHVRDLVFFGVHCFLVGALVYRSTFLPRFLGVLMMFAGLGWLTFAYPALVKALSPYHLFPGMLGEGALLLWLIVKGVDVSKWEAKAAAPRRTGA